MGGRLGQSSFDASSRETFEYLIALCSPSGPAFTLDCTDRPRFSTMVKSRSRYWSIRSYDGFVLSLLPVLACAVTRCGKARSPTGSCSIS